MHNPNEGVCALTGKPGACVDVEADGTLEGAYGSSYDTVRFVWMRAGDKLCDEAVAGLVAEGAVAPFGSRMSGPLAVAPEVFRRAFAVERGRAAELARKAVSSELPPGRALAALLDTRGTPNPFALALLDALLEAASGAAPGVDALLAPWLEQRRLRNEVAAGLDFDHFEGADDPVGGSQLRVVDGR